MKYLIILILLLFMPLNVQAKGYDMKLPVEGNSIANDAMQFDIMKNLYKELSFKYPACYNYSISNTQVVRFPYDAKMKNGKYIKGFWNELWTIDVCNQKIQVPISYSINKGSATYKIEKDFFTK